MNILLAALGLLVVGLPAVAADDGVVNRVVPPAAPAPVTTPSIIKDPFDNSRPWIAIIIDDMGNQPSDRVAILLPGPVACSFLPHTPHAVELAQLAARAGKEVLLHQPMQSRGGNKLGPGALLRDMDRATFRSTLSSNLAALPHVSGINNHMGSLLTSLDQPMAWLMTELHRYPSMFFIDSRTTAQTIAQKTATRYQIPNSSRDIFLDNQNDETQILAQFRRLIKLAKSRGSAIAIGHPYPLTMAMLKTQLPRLEQQGVSLRPVSDVIRLRQPALRTAWRATSPRSATPTAPGPIKLHPTQSSGEKL